MFTCQDKIRLILAGFDSLAFLFVCLFELLAHFLNLNLFCLFVGFGESLNFHQNRLVSEKENSLFILWGVI